MAVVYILTVFVLILLNLNQLPYFFKAVFGGAFTAKAVFGGTFGTVLVRLPCRRQQQSATTPVSRVSFQR